MNQVVLIGRLTRDPELRFVAGSGRAVANFTLAVDKNLSREKRKEFEEKGIPTADFIRIVVWGKQAENCANYLAKGRMVAINGSISTGSYKTNTGETRYTTEVLANNVQFLEWGDRQGGGAQKPVDDFSYGPDVNDFQAIEDDDDIPF
jgi:single-strand DNA-binding protein